MQGVSVRAGLFTGFLWGFCGDVEEARQAVMLAARQAAVEFAKLKVNRALTVKSDRTQL